MTAVRLLPGVPVLRRDARRLQVGLDPDARAVLPDEPEVRRLLERLRSPGGAVPGGDAASVRALPALAEAGLLEPCQPAAGDPGAGPDRPSPPAARVHLDAGPGLAESVLPGLREAGLEAVGDPDLAGVRLVLRAGAVARADLDDALRDGLPHLPVGAQPGSVVLGPLVVPGRTACLRCVDAHLGVEDPRWPFLVEQAAAGPPVPRDPVLLPLALAWAVGDLRAWAAGGTPSTWSATVRLRASASGGPRYERRSWQRHPGCGCAWDVGLEAG